MRWVALTQTCLCLLFISESWGFGFGDPCSSSFDDMKSKAKSGVPTYELINELKKKLTDCQPTLSITDEDKAEFVTCFDSMSMSLAGNATIDEGNVFDTEESTQAALKCNFPGSLSGLKDLFTLYAGAVKRRADEDRKTAKSKEDAADRKRQEELVQSEKEEAAENAKKMTPKYNAKKACACSVARTFTKSKIAEENHVGQIGGYVDKVKLHKLSNQYLLIEKAERYYKSKAKGTASSCDDVKRNWDSIASCLDDTPTEVFN